MAGASIRILAINDVYQLSNLPRLLNLRKSLRPKPDAFIVAGDFLSPSVLSSVDQGRGMVDMLNAIGVTHVCFGNHEADLPLDILSERIRESKFQWVNTNMPSFPGFAQQSSSFPSTAKSPQGTSPRAETDDTSSFSSPSANPLASVKGQPPHIEGFSRALCRPLSPRACSSLTAAKGAVPTKQKKMQAGRAAIAEQFVATTLAAATRTSAAAAANPNNYLPPPPLSLPTMTPAAYVASKCGKVNVVLLGLISDESDMFRDGTFKGVSIEPVAECVATAYDYFCAQGENDGGSSGSRRGRMKEHQWPLPRQPGEKSESETKRSKQPAYKRQTRDNNVAAAAVIPLTHETMAADAALATFCTAHGMSLPVIFGGHEHEVMLEVHPPGEALIPSDSAPEFDDTFGSGENLLLKSWNYRRRKSQSRGSSSPFASSSPSSFSSPSFSSSSSKQKHSVNTDGNKSKHQRSVDGTVIVKTGSDAEQAAVVDIHFNVDPHLPPRKQQTTLAGGTATVRKVAVAMVDVASFAPDLPAQRRAERHLSVVSNLEDAPLVDMSMFEGMFSISKPAAQVVQFSNRKNLSLAGDSSGGGGGGGGDGSCGDGGGSVSDVGGVPWGKGLGRVPLTSEHTRFRQSTVGALLCLAAREELGADVGAINGAPIKGNKAYGDGLITFRELKEELPFPTKMVTVLLPGKVLQAAVHHSRSSGEDGKERRGFLQLDPGVVVEGQYQWLALQTRAARGGQNLLPTGYGGNVYLEEEETASMEADAHRIVSIQGVPFDENRTYNVALPRNLLKGFCSIAPLVEWHGKAEAEKREARMKEREAALLLESPWEQRWMNFGGAPSLSPAEVSALEEDEKKLLGGCSSEPSSKPVCSLGEPQKGDVAQLHDKEKVIASSSFSDDVLSESKKLESATITVSSITANSLQGGVENEESLWENLWMRFGSLVGKARHGSNAATEPMLPLAAPLPSVPVTAAAAAVPSRTLEESSRLLPADDTFMPCLNIVVSYFTKAHWRELAATFTFDEIDQNKSGRINRDEVSRAFARKHGHVPPRVLLDSMMRALGKNSDDAISRQEFEALLTSSPGLLSFVGEAAGEGGR